MVEGPTLEPAADAPMSLSIGKQENPPMFTNPAEEKSVLGMVISGFLAFLFGFGSLLVVLFFFLPLIDQASLSRQQAHIDAGDRLQNRLDDKLWNRNVRRDRFDRFDRDRFDRDRFDPRFDKDRFFLDKDIRQPIGGPIDFPVQPNEDAQKRRANERKDWEKSRDKLEDDLEDSRGSARGRMYFYAWGQLFGFVILAIASVGFLSFGPTTTRRIFGGIVISAEILLIFIIYFTHYMNMTRFML